MAGLLKLLPFAALLLASLAAQADEGDWYISPSIAYSDDDGDRLIDDAVAGWQIQVGREMSEHFSLEGLLGYHDIDGFPGQEHLEIGFNAIRKFRPDSRFSPYAIGGLGYLRADAGLPDFGGVPPAGTASNSVTATVGLGLQIRFGDGPWALRAEYRLRHAFDSTGLTDQVGSLGVQYNFGGRPAVNANENVDTDGDGVLDIWDVCPNTKAGVEVTSRGCELKNLDRDDDQDRINNNVDQCPNTPIGVAVDRVGCSLDSDMDGVTTGQDRCPGSRAGADVDIYGCENDEDNDGVVDHRDDCLGTRAGARTDVKGCEIKDIISLPGVSFETGRDALLPGIEYLLQAAADTLKKHPDLQIEVAGHSDDTGDANMNIGLSMRRAKTVRNFLIRYGVEESRLTFKGYGEAQPIADNSTAEGRATNRRVELRVVNRETQ